MPLLSPGAPGLEAPERIPPHTAAYRRIPPHTAAGIGLVPDEESLAFCGLAADG